MPVDAKLREQIDAEVMRRGDVTPRNMMGTTAYMVRNRMFAFWVADGLVAKLPDQARQQFIDRKLGVLFQGAQGRGFGEWTRLHLEKQDDVAAAVEGVKNAYEYVKGSAGGVAKARKKKAKK
jgi:TfoX/Sxy family transcriptional regulator of competence genes